MMMQGTRGIITSLFTKSEGTSEGRDEQPGASSDHQKGMRQDTTKRRQRKKT